MRALFILVVIALATPIAAQEGHPLTTNQAARGVTAGPMYEYACHEGNHAIVNMLRGARAGDAAKRD